MTYEYEPLIFDDTELIQIPVCRKGVWFILQEALEGDACKFRDRQLAGTEFKGTSVSKIRGLAESEYYLVALCLYEFTGTFGEKGEPLPEEGGKYKVGKRVHPDRLKQWKHLQIKKLFELAQEISGLKEEEETVDELKKKIEALQDKVQELEEAGEDSMVKNELEGTMHG
jgi:hypothetical protein